MYFFVIQRQISETCWKPVYKSESQNAIGGSCSWNQANILTTEIAGNDTDRPIRIDLVQFAKSGKHKYKGQAILTL